VPRSPTRSSHCRPCGNRLRSLDLDDDDPDDDAEALEPPLLPVPVTLAPYVAWTPHVLPDPHGASQADLIAGLVEIVSAEGPIVGRRAYELYVRAAGGHRVHPSRRRSAEQIIGIAGMGALGKRHLTSATIGSRVGRGALHRFL
jgi:hypothetical protein